jgi:hypothetical protein
MALGLALSVASAEQSEPECTRLARALIEKVRDLSVKKRARSIELAVRRDVEIVCGVVEQSFFASPIELPKGCTMNAPIACGALAIIPLEKARARDVDPVAYARIETIAKRLETKGLLDEVHRTLLSMWLDASAKATAADREHAH